MPQTITFLDDKEDVKIKQLAQKWSLSKAETIRKLVREFKEEK
jgi:hypothetical protein